MRVLHHPRVRLMLILSLVSLVGCSPAGPISSPAPSAAPATVGGKSRVPISVSPGQSVHELYTAPLGLVSIFGSDSTWTYVQTYENLRGDGPDRTQFVTRIEKKRGSAKWAYASTPGWLAGEPVFAGNDFYFVEYSDEAGQSRVLKGSPGRVPTPVQSKNDQLPELVAIDGVAYVTTAKKAGSEHSTCLNPLSSDGNALFCIDGYIERLTVSGSTLSFTRFKDPGTDCGTLYVWDTIRGGKPTEADTNGCIYTGVGSSGITAWTTVGNKDGSGAVDDNFVPVWVRSGKAKPVELGFGKTGSIRLCGDTVYWNTGADPSKPNYKVETLRKWSPTGGAETVVSAPAGDLAKDTQISVATCEDGDAYSFAVANGTLESESAYSSSPNFVLPLNDLQAIPLVEQATSG